ncbi:MAG TPA: D-2-hydroxyacid dehydrogenase [Thermoanaerobaculia bacterium]|jgi:phosphoglycerate dehydrogenase-like enzyme|nr:D-2-hydroxyacid dehydrogenase [Thermoanaerobaculia bacterium]
MHLLVIAPPEFAPLDVLRREAPDVELSIGTNVDALRRDARNADAILIAPRYTPILTDLWPDLGNVKWIHTLAAGVESLPFDLLRNSSILITNSRGLYADALGEFAIAAMLWFAKDLRRLLRNQDARRWQPFDVQRLEGQTVGIIGYGGIGHAVGRRASALGMQVLTTRRRRELGDPTIEEVIADSHYVVMCAPLTPSTHRLLSRERLALMKSDAVFINIGRAGTVDEEALVEALQNQRIRGAALDVFEIEPLPAEHPLWRLDNVLLSPHSADHTSDAHVRAMNFFLENLRRFRAGESLENVVDKIEQY